MMVLLFCREMQALLLQFAANRPAPDRRHIARKGTAFHPPSFQAGDEKPVFCNQQRRFSYVGLLHTRVFLPHLSPCGEYTKRLRDSGGTSAVFHEREKPCLTNPHTPFPNPAVLFTDIFIISGVIAVVASITGFLLLRKAKEELTGGEKVVIAPTLPMAGEPPSIAGEAGN